jgi:hypothetical protein
MSELAFPDTHADRRQHARQPVQRPAEIILSDAEPHQACTVLDASAGGVLVEADHEIDMPEAAVIKFSESASQLVRRCWASGLRAGYQFVQIVPVQRSVMQEDHELAAQVDTLALNNFVALSRTLLNVFVTTPERLHSVEQVQALLAEMPLDQLLTGASTLQYFSIPEEKNHRPA